MPYFYSPHNFGLCIWTTKSHKNQVIYFSWDKTNNKTKGLKAPVKIKAYQSCVLPILEYASSSWQPTSDKSNNAARLISNAYSKKGEFKI